MNYLQDLDENSWICVNCISELNEACKIREKVVQAVEYQSSNFNVDLKNKQFEENILDYIENNCFDISVKEQVSDDVFLPECLNEEKISTFVCEKCKHVFMTGSELLDHHCIEYKNNAKEITAQVSNGKENDGFQCDICDKSFDKNWQLNRHTRVFHLNIKNYTCDYCNRAFKQLYHLQEHITTHTGEKKFQCDICSKTFSRMSSLRKHMKSHEAAPGEKSKKSPFLCSICGKKFPYSNGAQRHMRTHFDERRYECNICGNKFSQTTHLRVHLRTHTGEKPYPCKLCAESFSLKANLRKHMKNHKKPENVKICQSLEPNLSQMNGDFDFEDSQSDSQGEFIEREIPFSIVEGSL